MHAKSLITAALAIMAATSLVVITSRPTWAGPSTRSLNQDSLEQRVKALEAEVKQLRNELKELRAARSTNMEKLPIIGEYFKGLEGKGDSGMRKFFFRDGEFIGPKDGEWEKFMKDSPQNVEVESKDGKTIIKIKKNGEKTPRVYVLPGDKAKLEKDFPHMKFLGAEGLSPHRMGMLFPKFEMDGKAMAELEKHLKALGKEFGPEFHEKLRKEFEQAHKEMEKERARLEKEGKDIPPSGYDPEESDSISI